MINYVLYQNKNKENDSFGKWFARAVHQLVEFDEFIEHMAKHHCVYSEGTIKEVLIEMECCLREMLLAGAHVQGGCPLFFCSLTWKIKFPNWGENIPTWGN